MASSGPRLLDVERAPTSFSVSERLTVQPAANSTSYNLTIVGQGLSVNQSVPSGMNYDFDVSLRNSSGSPVQNVSVTVVTSLYDPIMPSATEATGTSGDASFTLLTPTVGAATLDCITASATVATVELTSSSCIRVSVEPFPYSLDLSRTSKAAGPVQSGQVFSLICVLQYGGNPVSNVFMVVTDSLGHVLGEGLVSLDTGVLTVTVTAPAVSTDTTVNFTATASELGMVVAQAILPVEVLGLPPTSFPEWAASNWSVLLGLGLAALAIVFTPFSGLLMAKSGVIYGVLTDRRFRALKLTRLLSAVADQPRHSSLILAAWNHGKVPLEASEVRPSAGFPILLGRPASFKVLDIDSPRTRFSQFATAPIDSQNGALLHFKSWLPDALALVEIRDCGSSRTAVRLEGSTLAGVPTKRVRLDSRWEYTLFMVGILGTYSFIAAVGIVFFLLPAPVGSAESFVGFLILGIAALFGFTLSFRYASQHLLLPDCAFERAGTST
jgi:hypothetical protein